MITNFPAALAFVLESEGGFTDNPADPGGATNKGVTQREYDSYRARHGLPGQDVRMLTGDEVTGVYREDYWDACRCDDLPAGVDYCVFDFAVNSGDRREIFFLQHVLYQTEDGVIGPKTLDAANRADPELLCFALLFSRLRFMQSLQTWSDFGKGWAVRDLQVLHRCHGMIVNAAKM